MFPRDDAKTSAGRLRLQAVIELIWNDDAICNDLAEQAEKLFIKHRHQPSRRSSPRAA